MDRESSKGVGKKSRLILSELLDLSVTGGFFSDRFNSP